MTTVNISLTQPQVKMIDQLTSKLGFASRSEFFRALLRWIKTNPMVVREAQTWPFFVPPTRSKKKILEAFGKTGQYSSEFLQDLAEGLNNSDYFRQ